MKIKSKKLLIISISLIILVCLSTFLTYYFINKNSNKNDLSYYTDSNIKYDKPKDINVSSYFYNDNKSIALVITDAEKSILSSDILITYYNSKNEKIGEKTFTTTLFKMNESYVIHDDIPDLSGNYAGNIKIKINPNYLEEDSTISLDKYNVIFEFDNDDHGKYVTIKLKAKNPFDAKIEFISGVAMIYKDNKLLDVYDFNTSNIEAGSDITTDIDVNYALSEYDSVSFIVNDLY